MQNSNFKNTYTIDEPFSTPTHQSGLPPSGSKSQKRDTITKKPYPGASGNQNLTPGASPRTRNGEGVAKQKTKTTSFSRIKRDVRSSSPLSSGGTSSKKSESVDSFSHTPDSNNYLLTENGVRNSISSSVVNENYLERPRVSTSQRLFAALEYSDQSSDEGSGHIGDGHRNSRGRHPTQTLNNDGYSEERLVYNITCKLILRV